MKFALTLSALLLLCGCAATLDERIKTTQREVDQAVANLGYRGADILVNQFEDVTKTKFDEEHTWQKKHLRLRDNYQYDWAELHKYFKTEVKYSEADNLDLRIGEAEADRQKVRSFEFVLDKWCEVYYIEFVRDIVHVDESALKPAK